MLQEILRKNREIIASGHDIEDGEADGGLILDHDDEISPPRRQSNVSLLSNSDYYETMKLMTMLL